ncbi:unnamed protein product, partial [Mesorhabditis belari]|uniref:Uncharacterized protein n=1 Tax=Mesorhabditis belari TaxID=2138241 RepID=A0AAF3F3I6_9BILA
MATPTVMVFPPGSNGPTRRTLIIRNPTNKDFVVKLVPSCEKMLKLEGEVLLLQDHKYAPVHIDLDQKVGKKAELSIYARPVERHNHASILEFCKGSTQTPHQLVTKLSIKVENGFAANDTILDVPGSATMFEAVTLATAGINVSDTLTCQPIDGDCATAPNMAADDFAKYSNQKLGEEKCWLFGPLIDALFPSATAESKKKSSGKGEEQSCNLCAAG